MPRESVDSPTDPDQVGVGWQRDGGVQVGVIRDKGDTGESLWADLDRQGCNRLITVLRRARDQAFGRDE